MRNRTEEA
ncbi:hypothetical protein SeMB42_g04247, partial [Synchytrium endobioticum]